MGTSRPEPNSGKLIIMRAYATSGQFRSLLAMRLSLVALFLTILLTGDVTAATRSERQKNHAAARPNAFDATATPAAKIKIANGFQVELLYSVPKSQYGSWVNL